MISVHEWNRILNIVECVYGKVECTHRAAWRERNEWNERERETRDSLRRMPMYHFYSVSVICNTSNGGQKLRFLLFASQTRKNASYVCSSVCLFVFYSFLVIISNFPTKNAALFRWQYTNCWAKTCDIYHVHCALILNMLEVHFLLLLAIVVNHQPRASIRIIPTRCQKCWP